jgi:outer membrane protein TolC
MPGCGLDAGVSVFRGELLTTGCLLKEPPSASELRDTTLVHASAPAQWSSTSTGGAVGDGWLASFGDTTLEALVTEALAYNADLQIAAARVEQARGYARPPVRQYFRRFRCWGGRQALRRQFRPRRFSAGGLVGA